MKAKLFLIFIGFHFLCFAQVEESSTKSSVDINYFAGKIALHDYGILHLIADHPEGVIISWSKKTFGLSDWEERFNYPDYGVSFSYQNFKNETLGNNYALYGHYNFYFLNRNLMLRIGQGLAYSTNPYDKETNHKNIAFGSKLLSSTYAMLNYKKERVIDKFGFQAGISFIHYSNANVKAPNKSVNSIAANFGLNYNFDDSKPEYKYNLADDEKYTESIKYNMVFRSGINESDIIGSGQFPFYIASIYADKRISRLSALQFGVDAFFSNFLKELIFYRSVAFSENNLDADTDYKRLGVFVGHELFINRLSVVTQLGFYAYYPFDFEGRVYQRIGCKRYFGDKWFAALTLKTHAAKAEALEFGIGIRL